MFRKPKRNFRQRIVQNDDSDDEARIQNEPMDTEDSKDSPDISDIIVTQKKKEKKKKEKSKSVLSFDHHEEGDTAFEVRKSSHSKKLARQLKKESQKERVDEELVEEERDVKPTIPAVPSNPPGRRESQEEHEDRILKLRQEFKIMNGDEAAAMDGEGSDDEGTFQKLLKRGEIPDATTIHQIRKQRQMARDMGDFLPLDDTVKVETNSSSRLIRDDDNDKSDEDEEGRVDFTINTSAVERQRMKDNFLAAEHGSEDEGSDQEHEWEEQQIQKGVSVIQKVASTQDFGESQSNDGMYSNGFHGNQEKHFQAFEALSKLSQEAKDVTMETVVKRLQERLNSMDEVHRSHMRESEKTITDLVDTKDSIEHCEASKQGLEDRFRFFQEMRGYVRDLVECLNEKVPIINDLESRMINLHKQRTAKFASRRQQDIKDQCEAYMTSKSQVVMDRDDHTRQRRVAEREARRARRRRARENKTIVSYHDGLSSDDEENQSEVTKFTQERDEIESFAGGLLEDVVDEFSETAAVRERFMEWKAQYSDTYKEAYIGLCLPRLVNPFIRLQLVNWIPLEDGCPDFEDLPWYDSLLFYGCAEGEPVDRDDDDVKLLPAIVDKVLLPRLATVAEHHWDPLSTSETCRFVNLVQKLQRDYPTVSGDSKHTKNLLKAIVNRMKKTLDDDVFMPLYPKTVLENRNSGPSVFFHRQSWTCIKLLGNFLSWHGLLAPKVLQGLSLDGLLNRYILLGLQTAPFNAETLQKCQAVVSTFPKQWFGELEEDRTIPQLEGLCRFLSYAAQLLEKASTSVREHERKDYRDQMKQISKLLVNIHAMDHAIKLSASLTAAK